jgi:uncharacterized protein GlcG (DUF336 family)
MGINFPDSPSAGDTYTYEGETYRYNGVAFVKVRDRVTTFNGATGAIIGVTSVQGKTGDVTLTDLEITHGVETFNGLSGSIDTTSLVLPVTGLSASGGITLSGDISIAGDIISQDNNLAVRGPGGSEILMSFLGSQTIINNSATDQDIIIKGVGDSQLFVTDAGNARVGIGTGTPTEKLDVNGTIKASGVTLAGGITFSDGTFLSSEGQIAFKNESNTFTQNNTFSANQIFSNGTGIGTDASIPSIRFNSNNLVTLGDPEEGSNGVKLTVSDSSQLVTVSGANLKASNSIQVGTSIFHDGDADTILSFGTDTIDFDAGGREGMKLTATETQFNNGITVTGISGPSGITFSNGEVIRNNPDGSIQIIPSDEGGNHYGIEIDATEWGFGPTITVIEEDGTQSAASIRFDSDLVMGVDADSTNSRLQFSTNGDRAFQKSNHNDGTVMFGVNDNNGHFAVGRKADLTTANRSMSTSDKTALGMTNPQFLVYSTDSTNANDYIRLEHDQTDANIFSGDGGINLVPLSGAVGISGGGLNVGTNGITFGDDTTQKTATKDVGTFTISASSAISTGAKTDALHRIPYNATLTKFELKSKATGGMTAAVYIAGADFGNPTNAFITGATAETTGFTADTTTFGTATVNEGDFVYLHVLANASGATAAQAFISYETR